MLTPEQFEAIEAVAAPEIGKRYAGPVIGEPDSYRWGSPGFDCSSFVSYLFRQVFGLSLVPFTDTAAGQTVDVAPSPGAIIFYEYKDSSQPGVRYPHMGIWVGGGKMLDCQWPKGCGYHDLLNRPYVTRLPAVLAYQHPTPEPDPGPVVAPPPGEFPEPLPPIAVGSLALAAVLLAFGAAVAAQGANS